ncbi:MAG: hypothetical protein KDA31_06640 [Phycisphaerales bacterium]|nr:hypothetical protein [Phycisphaerales bacterium]MCB9836118.1 hypothetical protein [Phycisphaera sp.]
MERTTLESPLTSRNAFLYHIQNNRLRRDILTGAISLLVPGIGWLMNMGRRIAGQFLSRNDRLV